MIADAQPSEDSLAELGQALPEEILSIVEAPEPVIITERLSKRFRGTTALRNVSIRVMPGEVYGLIGAPGAGKSTLVRLLLGLMRPDGGAIRLFGSDSLSEARARVGYLPEKARYHGNFTGRDYLRFHAELSGLKRGGAQRATDNVADTVGIGESARKLIGGYSRQMRQRLGLAVALLAGGADLPDLLILDEPATGYGDEIALLFREVVLDCKARGSTVLICSSELTPVERACTSVGILRSGRLLAQTHIEDSPRTHLIAVARERALEILPHLIRYLENLHPSVLVRGGSKEGEPLHVSLPAGPEVPHTVAMKAAALRAMVDARWDIVSIYSENRDLESLFLQAVPSSAPKPVKTVDAEVLAPAPTSVPETLEASAPDTEAVAEAPLVTSVEETTEEIQVEPAPEQSMGMNEPIQPITGPLPPQDVPEVPEARSPSTGPLETPEPAQDAGGNGIEPVVRSGPSTAPLPALDSTLNVNGYESAPSTLPVRTVTGGRRAGATADASEEVESGIGE